MQLKSNNTNGNETSNTILVSCVESNGLSLTEQVHVSLLSYKV